MHYAMHHAPGHAPTKGTVCSYFPRGEQLTVDMHERTRTAPSQPPRPIPSRTAGKPASPCGHHLVVLATLPFPCRTAIHAARPRRWYVHAIRPAAQAGQLVPWGRHNPPRLTFRKRRHRRPRTLGRRAVLWIRTGVTARANAVGRCTGSRRARIRPCPPALPPCPRQMYEGRLSRPYRRCE